MIPTKDIKKARTHNLIDKGLFKFYFLVIHYFYVAIYFTVQILKLLNDVKLKNLKV